VHNSLKLIIRDYDSMCNIFPTTFRGSTRAWYNNLEPNSIVGFINLCVKLMTHFSNIILAKKTFTKLFSVAQEKGKFTWAYFRRFNAEMLKVEELIEPVILEALIKGANKHALWRKLYVLQNRSFSKVKQFMENHIQVEATSLL